MADTAIMSFDNIIRILNENGHQIDDEESTQIKTILSQCENDKNKFINNVIGSYAQRDTSSTPTTARLPNETPSIILFRYIKNIDLDTSNIINMASIIIPKLKKGDQVDISSVSLILKENKVSGLVFMNGTKEYMNGVQFSRLFKPLSNWKETKSVFSSFWKEMNKWEPMMTINVDKSKKAEHDGDEMRNLLNSSNSVQGGVVSIGMGAQEEEQKYTVSGDARETECKLSFSECTQCQRIKNVLVRYQRAVSQLSEPDEIDQNCKEVIDELFDDNYTATDLLDDFQHIVREHHINDDHSRFDSCFEFMTNTEPQISCDISKCKAATLYFSRRRGRIDGVNSGNIEIPSDYRTTILWQIHSFLVHSLETTMLTKKERMDIEEEIKMRGDDDEIPEDLKLELVAEKMQKKSILMEKIVDNAENSKFVTQSDFVENGVEDGDEEKVEVVTSLDEEEAKYPEQIRRPTIYQDDEQILERFCNLTNCDAAVAMVFLKKSDWNFQIAINRFYEFSGDPTQIESFWEEKEEDIQEDDGVYTEGIRFWYWRRDESMPGTAVPVTRQHETLKEEILNSGHVGMATWTRFVAECTALLRAKFVRNMSANGIGEEIYDIRAGDPFAWRFMLALKLYTDFDALNQMFCEHFRLRKLTPHSFESVRSLVVRNGRFWNFAKLLVECVQCFGRLLVRKKSRYYRGIGRQFILRRFVARFHVPLSTSKSVCSYITSSLSLSRSALLLVSKFSKVALHENRFLVAHRSEFCGKRSHFGIRKIRSRDTLLRRRMVLMSSARERGPIFRRRFDIANPKHIQIRGKMDFIWHGDQCDSINPIPGKWHQHYSRDLEIVDAEKDDI